MLYYLVECSRKYIKAIAIHNILKHPHMTLKAHAKYVIKSCLQPQHPVRLPLIHANFFLTFKKYISNNTFTFFIFVVAVLSISIDLFLPIKLLFKVRAFSYQVLMTDYSVLNAYTKYTE